MELFKNYKNTEEGLTDLLELAQLSTDKGLASSIIVALARLERTIERDTNIDVLDSLRITKDALLSNVDMLKEENFMLADENKKMAEYLGNSGLKDYNKTTEK